MSIEPVAVGACDVSLEDKVAFLRQPQAYAERPRRVATVETHMSWVFLSDRHAYKLKKPVRYDFLDFSTLEARRLDCDEEVRLNRRLAADVYLEIVALTIDPQGKLCLGGAGPPIDWLVKMRRLPSRRMLDQAIKAGSVERADIQAVARKLSEFYKSLPPVGIGLSAYRRRLEGDVRSNLEELTQPRYRLPASKTRRIATKQLEFLGRHGELFDERVRAGRIVEAHGDLRAEHVCLEAEPVIIDCLEFKREFRLLDPADELAFLALDCERLGAAWVRPVLFDTYGEVTGDDVPASLIAFYGSCRALLRAKIALWHLREPDARKPTVWPRLARRYLKLAEAYAAAFE
jgi:aminoglycoside phosphotransferase family enzyme